MLQRQAHSLLEKPIAGLIRTAHSGDNMGPVPFPGGEASFVLPLRDKGAGEVDLVPLIGTGPATFTRATTATTVLSNGLIGSVASGTPRSWYWPDTLAYGGYLAEGARTNLCLQSEDFATTWVSGGANVVTVSGDAAVAPDGNMTADRLTASTGGSSSRAQSLTVAAVVYSFSCFFKADTATSVEFGILQGSFQAVSARIM